MNSSYVKITGQQLFEKAQAVFIHFQNLNDVYIEQDRINQEDCDTKRAAKIVELDFYRDSGKAWADFDTVCKNNVEYTPIKFLFLTLGHRESIIHYKVSVDLDNINYSFWSYISDVSNITPESLSKFNNYCIRLYPEVTKKHDLTKVKGYIHLANVDEVFLSLEEYQELHQMWVQVPWAKEELLAG